MKSKLNRALYYNQLKAEKNKTKQKLWHPLCVSQPLLNMRPVLEQLIDPKSLHWRTLTYCCQQVQVAVQLLTFTLVIRFSFNSVVLENKIR